MAARIRPGQDVAIIDVSAGGALVEGSGRLLPGTVVELHLRSEQQEQAVCVKGRVGRCSIARLRPDSIRYRGAIVFDQHLSRFFDQESRGYSVPISEDRRADTTRSCV